MSRDLQWARSYLREAEKVATDRHRQDQYKVNANFHATLNAILNHLEESQPQPASESSSSPDTVKPEETSDTLRRSWTGSFRANQDGTLPQSVQQAISDWLSMMLPLGLNQEVEIGVTLTSRAATPPYGSASSSPAEAVSQGSGHAGDCECLNAVTRWHNFYWRDNGFSPDWTWNCPHHGTMLMKPLPDSPEVNR